MKILFQGDSVTDAGRDRSNPHDMGEGYAKFASAMIEDAFPDVSFEFCNLGISGNRTCDLVERLENDFVEIQPDIVSVLIGINDVWHYYLFGKEVTDREFEANYRKVLDALRQRTNAKILLIDPFLIAEPDQPQMRAHLDRFIGIVHRLAAEYADAHLPLQEIMNGEIAPEDRAEYAADGVHPTQEGACLIGERYLEAVTPLIRALIPDDGCADT